MTEYITQPPLDAKKPHGAVGEVTYHEGVTPIIKTKDAPMDGGEGINITASGEDRGAKWERPHSQDVHPSGENQYEPTQAKTK